MQDHHTLLRKANTQTPDPAGAGKDGQQRNSQPRWWERGRCSAGGRSLWTLTKLNILSHHVSRQLHSLVLTQGAENCLHKTCTQTFRAALLITAGTEHQTRCPPVGDGR